MAYELPASAQDVAVYPSKSIKVIVPYPPGGATDIIGRTVAPRLSESWKVPVVVENRAGGNANIGADSVAKSDLAPRSVRARGTDAMRKAVQTCKQLRKPLAA